MLRGNSSTICPLSTRRNGTEHRTRTALITVLSVAAAQPAWAQNTTPNPPPTPPPSVVTSSPALSTVGAGGCVKQYTAAINHLADQANIAQDAAVTSLGIGAAAAVANATAQAA